MSEAPLAAGPATPARRRAGRARGRRRSWIGPVLVTPYVAIALTFGVFPALYALWLSVTSLEGGFAGLSNFTRVIGDFRFWPAVQHVAMFLGLWLVLLVTLVVTLAIIVQSLGARWMSSSLRFAFYLPGALAGASSVLLWLFILDPAAGPVRPLLRLLGLHSFNQVIQPSHLPLIFALMAFWTGAGGWIVVMYGALNNITQDIMEAARIDGASRLQVALRIQLPLMRKWIAYMVVLTVAAGTQLFVEPALLSTASTGMVPNDYSINQLAYQYAFQLGDFNGAAAIAMLLLVVSVALSAIFVLKGGLFDTEAEQ